MVYYSVWFSPLTVEAKTRPSFAERPSLATDRMRFSESFFADGLNPHLRLSDGGDFSLQRIDSLRSVFRLLPEMVSPQTRGEF